MEEFDFFRGTHNYYYPKTPAAALKAYETGFNPIEMYIFKSGSTRPLNEEPFDVDGIERLLARKNLDLHANRVLISIFEKLIYSNNQELALFAAESINIIENRYNKTVEALKKTHQDQKEEVDADLGTVFFELAMINGSRKSIKKFYFKESYECFTRLRRKRKLLKKELKTVIHILLELELYKNALGILEKECAAKDADYLFLKTEIVFAMGDYSAVFALCRELLEKGDELSPDKRNLVSYWTGGGH